MDLVQIIVLAVIQGVTEFLPVSSSAHLILLPVLSSWPDQGLAFDVALHVGTLAAVLGYFRVQLRDMARDWWASLCGRGATPHSRLAWLLLLATFPIGAIGLVVDSVAGDALRSPLVIALATIGFGIVLWLSDRAARQVRAEHALNWKDVLIIGLAQALALIPGTSRSGITISAGLMLGLTREASARFSFLLAIPVITLAGGHKGVQAWTSEVHADWAAIALGTVLAGVCAYACIHIFLKLVARIGMLPFVVYRLALGGALLAFVV